MKLKKTKNVRIDALNSRLLTRFINLYLQKNLNNKNRKYIKYI